MVLKDLLKKTFCLVFDWSGQVPYVYETFIWKKNIFVPTLQIYR